LAEQPTKRESPGPWRVVWRKLRKNRVACTGGVILMVFYACACFAGFLAPYDYDDRDNDSSRAPPMVLGGYTVAEGSRTENAPREIGRKWEWFAGGVHFHDSDGRFTLRPHVHPLVERFFVDEHGDKNYAHACEDRSVSVPIEFFVRSDSHEVFSFLGISPVHGSYRLFGVRKPAGVQGSVRVYLLGSDDSGRDIFSRLLYGAQISLSVGIFCICVTLTLGMIVGGLSGYFGGWYDMVVMRFTELLMTVPDLYLLIVLGGVLRDIKIDGKPMSSRQTYLMIVFIMSFIGWAARARVIRGMVLSLRENDYVVAARALGVSSWRVILRHILPNTFSFAIVSATLAIPGYILGEVALSYLGLGIQEPEASWGNMLREAQKPAYLLEHPWVVVPGVFIFVTVLAFNFLGDGLRDAADPRAVIARSMKKDLAAAKKKDERPAAPKVAAAAR
jgi:peptide/nickel transport system permease protein